MVDWDFPGSDRTAPFTPAPDRDFITLPRHDFRLRQLSTPTRIFFIYAFRG